MRVGILGSGLMGGKLGTIFARAGHEVIFSYARREQKLKTLARNAKGQLSAAYAVIRCRRKCDSTLSPRLAPVPRTSTTHPLFPTSDGILWTLGQLQDCYRTMFEPARRSCRGEDPPTRSTARS